MRKVFVTFGKQNFRYHRSSTPRSTATRWNSTLSRQWSTPLAKSLADAITTTGPVSIANYMRQCLTSSHGGYYTTRSQADKDQFGKTGDFVTSPEISQIFGELVGIWFVAEWMAQGQAASGVQLIELGPGRGTLMSDVLRTIQHFKAMAASIEAIYLIEASPTLRKAQRELLCGHLDEHTHPIGYSSSSKQIPQTPVIWAEDISFLPKDPNRTNFIVAHEFFDALPIHAFQSVARTHSEPRITTSITSTLPRPTVYPNEWRELMVSTAPPPSVIAPPKNISPEFEMTLAHGSTHHSKLLPNISPRYKALLAHTGSIVEISPTAQTNVSHVAQLIDSAPQGRSEPSIAAGQPSGAALIIDYGPTDTIPTNSLRGIRAHARVSPFHEPGLTDLSVDVDFGALAEAALSASPQVEVHGPVEQGAWLESMGGRERADMLMRAAMNRKGDGVELKSRIDSGWRRLIDRGPNGMGKLYKVMAILPRRRGSEGRKPVGFGGQI